MSQKKEQNGIKLLLLKRKRLIQAGYLLLTLKSSKFKVDFPIWLGYNLLRF